MTLDEFLGRLKVERRSETGESKCFCPAHNDRNTASLDVTTGVSSDESRYPGLRRIFFKCWAGCSASEVLSAMGLKYRDLYIDPIPQDARQNEPRQQYTPTTKPQAAQKQTGGNSSKQYMSYESAFGWLGNIERMYEYTDKDGLPVFRVVRIRRKDGDKTFRQCRRVNPEREFPIITKTNDLSEEQRTVLYHLPQVLRGIQEGRTIYLAEGEKDAETLLAHGMIGTTHAGGADKSTDRPKWHAGHNEWLRGADVVILPDNDEPGKTHAQVVAGMLLGVAKRVRLADLKTVWPEIPEHGDVSDMLQALGEEAWARCMDKLASETPDYNADGKHDLALAAGYYQRISGYEIYDGCICQTTADGPKRLANFVAVPRMEIIRDDGEGTTMQYEVDGWSREGRRYPRAKLTQQEYQNKSMSWLLSKWGFGATVLPGNTTVAKVQYAISEVGYLSAGRRTEYTHTGWRKLDGKWAYLYEGGAIGTDSAVVALDGTLRRYSLCGGDGIKAHEGAACTWEARNVMAQHVYVPLAGLMFLSPLREFLVQGGTSPAFALYLRGTSGAGKTVAASLMLSHFGDFRYDQDLPGSFHDSPKSEMVKAFTLKDMPLLVDDYHPQGNIGEKRQMDSIAQWLLRAFGGGGGRSTLNADQTLKSSRPPRCLGLMTGEQLPDVGPSGIARMYVVNIQPPNRKKGMMGDVPKTEALTNMQEKARQGYLQASMRGYIKWLIAQADELPTILARDFVRLRQFAASQNAGQHDRMPGALAHIMLGYSSMLRYLRDMNVLTDAEMRSETESAWDVLLKTGLEQSNEMSEDKPARRFIDTLGDLVTGGVIVMRDVSKAHQSGAPNVAGFKDEDYYYFLPDIAYKTVAQFYQQQNGSLMLGQRQLYKELRDEGLIAADEKANSATRVKLIAGKAKRLLWIPRRIIDGAGPEKDMQTGMEISDEDVPF